ncbi:MAG: STAS domain-containing protein [Verrucomicrobiia bacterium]
MASFSIERPFELQERQRDDLTILFAEGLMEKIELGVLETALKRLARAGRHRVIVDFSEVTTLSTLVVAGFVICAESFRSSGGEMMVTGVSRSLRNAFQMIDSDGKINQQTDVVAAIKAMSPRSAEKEG